mmetsp:Transcript_1044/g.3253  ORF Transcript_1044/g.3253 Transcript_1044/m.3253 type:complete len:132 (-) Transcript_1044:234-629(-)
MFDSQAKRDKLIVVGNPVAPTAIQTWESLEPDAPDIVDSCQQDSSHSVSLFVVHMIVPKVISVGKESSVDHRLHRGAIINSMQLNILELFLYLLHSLLPNLEEIWINFLAHSCHDVNSYPDTVVVLVNDAQ